MVFLREYLFVETIMRCMSHNNKIDCFSHRVLLDLRLYIIVHIKIILTYMILIT